MNRKTANHRNFGQARIRFDDAEYRRSHMHPPRGRGSWAFRFDQDEAPWFAPSNLTFTEAKQDAAAEARRRGAAVAHVQP